MRKAHDELGQTVKHSSEDEMGGRDSRLEGVAQQVREVVGAQALVAYHLDRVQKERKPARFDTLEYREERRVRQVLPQHLGGDIEAANPGKLRRALDFPLGDGRLVHR